MILSNNSIEYFRSLHSRILQSMARHQVKTPYWFDDEVFFNQYECLRSVWSQTSSIKPKDFEADAVNIFPSRSMLDAAIAPSILITRVVPPPKGNSPTKISGSPIFVCGALVAIR